MYPIENDTVQPRRSQRCTAVPSSKVRDDARYSTEPNHAKQEATDSNGKVPDDVNRRDKMFIRKVYRDIRVYVSQHAACGRELFSIR